MIYDLKSGVWAPRRRLCSLFPAIHGVAGAAGGGVLGPVVESTATSTEDASVTTHTVSLPSGIVSGNLLIALFSHDGGNGGGEVEFPETDWTKFFEVSNGGSNTLAFAYRWADGGEGATISVDTQNAEKSSHLAYRLSGAVNPSSQAPEASTGATGASATPDPDSLTPAGGAKDFLWLAVAGNDGNTEPSAYPTNYTDGFSAKASSPATCGVGSAQRSLNASSENPGTFTIGFSEQWVAAVIAVHPA